MLLSTLHRITVILKTDKLVFTRDTFHVKHRKLRLPLDGLPL